MTLVTTDLKKRTRLIHKTPFFGYTGESRGRIMKKKNNYLPDTFEEFRK